MISISYNDYKTGYNTSEARLIPEGRFLPCVNKAEAFLSSLTMGRLPKPGDASGLAECVLQCILEIAELFYVNSQRYGISSENNDGYSVTYSGGAAEKAAADAAYAYLGQTGLLYRGIG